MILKNKTLKEIIVSILNYYKVKNYDKLIEEAKKILKKKNLILIYYGMLLVCLINKKVSSIRLKRIF